MAPNIFNIGSSSVQGSVKKYTIFGSGISLFTRKLEAAFECYGVPFEIKPKTAEIKTALEARAATHQIPVLDRKSVV